MLCPKCGYADQSIVTDTRLRDGGIRRRRKCLICGHRFSTMELIVPAKMKSKDYIKMINEMGRNEK